jgi:hypothetical protein
MAQRKGDTRMTDDQMEEMGIPSLKGYADSRSGSDIEPDNTAPKGMADGSDKRFTEGQAGRSGPSQASERGAGTGGGSASGGSTRSSGNR